MGLETDIANPDEALWVKFDRRPVQNNHRTQMEGHPCFDEKVFISIISPGDPYNKVERPIKDADKGRFHKQWANFERGQSDKVEGTPIEEWPKITRAQAEELKYLGIRSVEQLCAASDNQVQKIMAGASLKMQAQAYLASAKKTAEAERLAVENAILNDRIKTLEAQIAAISDKVMKSDQTQAIPKRRGHPPKVKPLETA